MSDTDYTPPFDTHFDSSEGYGLHISGGDDSSHTPDVQEELAAAREAASGMSARSGSGEREDRPHYGVLKPEHVKGLYDTWKSTTRVPGPHPEWEELGQQGKAMWMNSQHGRKAVAEAKRGLAFSEQAGRKVTETTVGAKGGTTTTATGAKRYAEWEKRSAVRSATGSIGRVNAADADSIKSPYATAHDYTDHKNLNALVDRLEASHNGTNSSVTQHAEAARDSISDSIKAQATGKNQEAQQHFATATTHVMNLARAVNGAAHNAGTGASLIPSGMTEASAHMASYNAKMSKIKRVN